MNELEKIDFTLEALYISTKDGGMLKIAEAYEVNQQSLTLEELQKIKMILTNLELAVFQTEKHGLDYRGAITDEGIHFVENNSFSKPGTSILNL